MRGYFAAITHDFGTPIASMRMGMKVLLERFSGDPSLAKLLTGMDAALDAMQAIKEEALDICNLQHGGTLRPKLSSVNIRDVVEGKLRPLSEHIPRGNIKVNG